MEFRPTPSAAPPALLKTTYDFRAHRSEASHFAVLPSPIQAAAELQQTDSHFAESRPISFQNHFRFGALWTSGISGFSSCHLQNRLHRPQRILQLCEMLAAICPSAASPVPLRQFPLELQRSSINRHRPLPGNCRTKTPAAAVSPDSSV